MDDAVEKLKTILAQNPNALRESFTNAPEMLEKVVLRLVELSKERPELRQMIRFVLPRIIPLRPVPEDLRQFLKEPPPLTLTAMRAIAQLFTDDDIRRTVQSVPMDWQKLALANWVRQELMPEADIRSVFAALGDADESLRSALHRMVRIERNPGGTGRKREREVAESSIVSDEEPSPIDVAIDPHTPDPAEVVTDADAVERVLAQFGERTAQLLRLYLQGYSLSEAARQLGIAPATARKLKERAQKKIEQYLKNRL
jgi:RNA polymerase sigma factor (sigma-70 family)